MLRGMKTRGDYVENEDGHDTDDGDGGNGINWDDDGGDVTCGHDENYLRGKSQSTPCSQPVVVS